MEAGRTWWGARSRWIWSAALCLGMIPLLASEKQKPQKSDLRDSAQIHDPSQYVGSQECKTCHEEEFKSYDHGAHWKIDKDPKGDVTKQGCEGCHGPGKAHAEEGGKLETLFRFTGRSAE